MINNQRLFQLLEAIEAERSEEEQFFQRQIGEKSLKDRAESGIAWYPVKWLSSSFTLGDYIEVKIEKTFPSSHAHKFREGNGVNLLLSRSGVNESLRATITRLGRSQMTLLCKAEEADDMDLPLSHIHAVELVYDEKPFMLMREAVGKVIESSKGSLFELKKAIYGEWKNQEVYKHTLIHNHPGLNDSQKQAISIAMGSEKVAVIHGPPGTGKTTTLTALIGELLEREKRVLVCASSNHATDLLAIKCIAAGYHTLRIGNLSRVGDDVLHVTLDERVRKAEGWEQIKKWRIEAEKLRRQAAKFRRNFGSEEREMRKQLFGEARQTLKYADELEESLVQNELTAARVIVTTLVSSASSLLNKLPFETLIIDEASQATEPECWIAMSRVKNVILAGDHMQLPPTVKTKRAMEAGLQKTLLEYLMDRGCASATLTVQYRMVEEVLAFPNQHFYDRQLMSGEQIAPVYIFPDVPGFIFIDTAGTGFEEVRDKESLSLFNPGECTILLNHLRRNKDNLMGREIAIISPYAEQVRYINDQLKEQDESFGISVDCDTVDGFQGQERDVVYISLVRSNDEGEVGFLADLRRLNVAITRAKFQVVVIGDSATLSRISLYGAMIRHAEDIGGYQSAWDYMEW